MVEEVLHLEEVEPVPLHELGDDLVNQDVVGLLRDLQGLHYLLEGAPADDHALQGVVAVHRHDDSLAGLLYAVAAAAHPLEEPGHLPWAVVVDDEVDGADVDAQLQAAGADDRPQVACPEPLLGGYPAGLREAAVVDAEREIGVPQVEPAGQGLAGAPGVGEDEGGVVLLYEVLHDLEPHRHLRVGEELPRQLVVLGVGLGVDYV